MRPSSRVPWWRTRPGRRWRAPWSRSHRCQAAPVPRRRLAPIPTACSSLSTWRAAGQPVVLEQDQSTFLSIRLARFSSISGAIVDENDVGLPDHEVVAMTNTRPPRMLVKAQADDRGMYRIAGLDPGAYLVRTLARPFEDGGYLPTFY